MTGRFDPPAHYDDAHRTLWANIVNDLTTGGRIFTAPPAVIDALVEARHTHQRATRLLAQTDILIIRDGKAAENPALVVQRKSAETIARLSHALGLDRPSSMTAPEPAVVHDSKCGGKTRAGGKCGRPAGWGTRHPGVGRCKLHGGASPSHEIAAARLAPYREISPGLGLLEEVHRSAGMVAWLEAECAALPREALWQGVTRVVDRDGVRETVTEGKPHVKLVALNREREHFASVCDRALARGAEQQVIDIAKVVGGAAVRVVDKVLADLDLLDWQKERIPRVVPAAFRAITAGPGK